MLCLLASLLIWKSDLFLKATGYQLVGEFENINGLLPNAEVRYRGFSVGKVTAINPGPEQVEVVFWVDESVSIPKGSYLRVIFDGLVGEKFLDIQPNRQSQGLLESGERMPGYATSGLADFMDVGTQNLEELKVILAAFKDTFSNPEVQQSLKSSLLKIEEITTNFNDIASQLKEFSDKESLKNIVSNLERITDQMAEVMDDDFSRDTKEVMANLNAFSKELRALAEDQELRNDIKATVKQSRRSLKGTGDVLGVISSIDLGTSVDFRYLHSSKDYVYRANFDFWVGDSYLHLGVGNRLGADQLLNIQQSIPIGALPLRTRFGIFYTKPGVGFDYHWHKLTLSTDAYDFKDTQLDITARWQLLEFMSLIGGVNNVLNETDKTYTAGFSLYAPNQLDI